MELQQEVVTRLFRLLGQVLVLCNSPIRETFAVDKKRKKKKKIHASYTASSSSTVAEEIVVLLRRLHPLPVWNKLVNNFIGAQLQKVPELIRRAEAAGASGHKTQEDLSREQQVSMCL